MLILACDTSNAACSAGLFGDGRMVAQSLLSVSKTHSLTFMPMVHDLMQASGHTYHDLDAFACTVGPGSFTGIRIGVSAVKAMGMVADVPVIPVSSLAALAYPFSQIKNTMTIAMSDARNRRVFSAAYYEGQQVVEEAARTVDELIALCGEWEDARVSSGSRSDDVNADGLPGHTYILCGDAADTYVTEDFFAEKCARVPDLFAREIQPGSIAALAFQVVCKHEGKNLMDAFPPEGLMPVYRARTSAERLMHSKEEQKP
jgi:tRNA threonylcarbamoyl adenosine modification protein YeaZ